MSLNKKLLALAISAALFCPSLASAAPNEPLGRAVSGTTISVAPAAEEADATPEEEKEAPAEAATAAEAADPKAEAEAATAPDAAAPAADSEAEKLTLEYQISEGPRQTAQGTAQNPFLLVLEILRANIAAATKTPGQAVKGQVFVPYPPEMIDSVQGQLPQIDTQTLVAADGKGSTSLTMAAFNSPVKEGDQTGVLEWGGLQGKLDYTGDLQSPSGQLEMAGLHLGLAKDFDFKVGQLNASATLNPHYEPLKLDMSLPSISFNSETDHGGFTLNGLAVKADLTEPVDGLKLGTGAMSIAEINVDTDGERAQLKGLRIDSEGKGKNDNKQVDYSVGLSLDTLSIPPALSPDLTSLSVSWQMIMQNLDAGSVASLQKTVRETQGQGMDESMMGMILMGEVMKIAPTLIKGSPGLSLENILIKTEHGQFKGRVKFHLDGSKPFPFDKPEVMKLAVLGDARLEVSKTLLKKLIVAQVQSETPPPVVDDSAKGKTAPPPPPTPEAMADMQIQAFVAQKFLVDAGENYTVNATLKAGHLLVNGQEVPLPF